MTASVNPVSAIRRPMNPLLTAILLIAVLLAGGTLRFWSVNWDDFTNLHPDERFLTVNLLPLVGGGLEFTNAPERFPAHAALALADSGYTLQAFRNDPTARVGAVAGTPGERLAAVWLAVDRALVYESPQALARALADGEIQVALIDDIAAGVLSAEVMRLDPAGAALLTSVDSVTFQQFNCRARYPQSGGIGGYFDTECSPLNPHNAGAGFYAYGTLPLFLAHGAGEFVRTMEASGVPPFDFQSGTLVWRVLSAFFDIGAILFIFLTGARLHNRKVGLIAALLYAFAPLAIQKAHFGTVNAISAFFVTLAIWAAAGVQNRGRWRDYIIFGAAFGASLAGRINLAPLAGLIVLAGLLRAVPAFDTSIPWETRRRILLDVVIGWVISGLSAILIFRITNPYAFTGSGIIPTGINSRWLGDLASASFGVSGAADSPPNWQWVGRPSYFFPLKDMFLWGMGIALGLMAWFGWGWSLWRFLRGRVDSLRNILLIAWVGVYFAWIGNLWVMTMRYYLPLYSALALLAAWAVYALWQESRKRELLISRWLLILFAAILGAVPAYYLLRGEVVTTTAWTSGAVALVLLAGALLPGIESKWRSATLGTFVIGFTVLWGLMYHNIQAEQLTRVQASRWVFENIPGDFAMQIDGAPEGTPLINIGLFNLSANSARDGAGLVQGATRLLPQTPTFYDFVAREAGTIDTIEAPHLADQDQDDGIEILQIEVSREIEGFPVVEAIARLETDLNTGDHPLGDSYSIPFDTTLELIPGETYSVKIEALAGTIISGGSVLVTEGDWDDRLTIVGICSQPEGMRLMDNLRPGMSGYDECEGLQSRFALVQSFDMDMSYPVDEAIKRDSILTSLEMGDYLSITSNRFYDGVDRNRLRWPLSSEYYDLLFAGELGYDLVATFDEHFELGPLAVADQHLPSYDSPEWFDELEADEAFHVYNHPAVFIFQKRADYDHELVEALLTNIPITRINEIGASAEPGADLVGVVYWTSLEADQATTAFMMTPEQRAINTAGGTWSERFDSSSPLYTNQVLGVAVWWLVMIGYGLAAWPLLFAAFPGLADRGYGFAKLIALLLISWSAWVAATLQIPAWSQTGIFLLLVLLAIISARMAWLRRDELRAWLAEHWRRIVWIEVLTLALFLFLILIRLTNPDLWHNAKGGEKPMDFAYFNAVLRTTTFPPIDPWYAGGYINYYYYGFVLVGSPVLLLKLVPAFAYNLIIPTIFALTGIGAFSAAFSIVEPLRNRRRTNGPRRLGNPWVAGIAALMLCVVLGNLDTIRVLGNGMARLGGYQQPSGITDWLRDQYLDEYGVPESTTGQYVLPPDREADLINRLNAAYITDRLRYELEHSVSLVSGLASGFGQVLNGAQLPIGSDRWYWGPTRVLAETPGVEGGAITEMPYFTFLYGDLHAHMINLPVMLFAIAFIFNEIAIAGRRRRQAFATVLALTLGALAVGMMRAINTWDWPGFTLLSIAGLGYAWWLRWQRINRWSLTDMLLVIGSFMVISFAVALPYTSWYASQYSSVHGWSGGKTPLWAYLDIHGLFIFLIASLLAWETGRWLRGVKVKALRGQARWLQLAFALTLIIALGLLVVAAIEYQVVLIAVPLILWIVPLFFRPDQSREMQYVLVLIGLGLAMTAGVEFVVLDGDIARQNTVFKFYMQVWILFSVAGGAAFAWLLQASDDWRRRLQLAWYVPLVILFAIAALFPLMATRGRMMDRMLPFPQQIHTVQSQETLRSIADFYDVSEEDLRELNNIAEDASLEPDQILVIRPAPTFTTPPPTLDGLQYMSYAGHVLFDYGVPIELKGDYEMIRWLQENVQSTPVIIEGRSLASEYRWNARIAINTGLPSVLGWNFHQRQQRTLSPLPELVQQRERNVKTFYNTPDIDTAARILRHYEVRYIIIGEMERVMTDPAGLTKFEVMQARGLLDRVFVYEDSVIYEVNQAAINEFVLEGRG